MSEKVSWIDSLIWIDLKMLTILFLVEKRELIVCGCDLA